MSQNKTRVPGMEPEENRRSGGQQRNNVNHNFYSRSSANRHAHGTYVPGMDYDSESFSEDNGSNTEPRSSVNPQRRRNVQSGKPVVGFLYSISRTAAGEFWPLQVGRNSIGLDSDSDVLLAEESVSGNHAQLIIQKNNKTGALLVGLKDLGSSNGTMINGEMIGFEPTSCENGDIITIGANYELVLILIDPTKYQLSVSKDFRPADVEEIEEDEFAPNFGRPGGTNGVGGFDPYSEGPTNWGSTGGGYGSPTSNGTVGMDGTSSFNKGGTRSI